MSNTTSTLMTEGTIWKRIITFAFPLFWGNLFQQLYNTADSLIVGNFLGDAALAAVSSSGSLIFLMVGFFNGISIGAGVVIARAGYLQPPEGNPYHHRFWANLRMSPYACRRLCSAPDFGMDGDAVCRPA